jgi:hypothetical protein
MKSRWLLLTSVVIGIAAWGISATSSPEIPREPLAAAPAGSSVVARIDVGAVTASHLWRVLLEEDQDEEGMRRIERVCGYDPLQQVDEVVVFVSGGDERPFEHVGFLARGEMARGRANRERLVGCVSQVVGGGRGGGMRQVEVEGEAAIASSSGESQAAFLGSDGVVGGDRQVVAQAIRVARRDAPAAATDPVLQRLWSRVSADRDVVAVAHVPSRWLPAMRRMARESEGELAALTHLRALGIGARLRGGLALGVAAETDGPEGAARIAALVDARVQGLLSDPLTRLSAIGRALRRVRAEANGSEIVLTLSLRDEDIDALLALWRQLRTAAAQPERPAGPGEPAEPTEPTEPTDVPGPTGAEPRPAPPTSPEPAPTDPGPEEAPTPAASSEAAPAPPPP